MEQDASVGALALPVSIEAGSTQYRLSGTFAVSGFEGDAGVARRVRTSDSPDAQALELQLPPGGYAILLEPGWTLTHREAGRDAPVAAELVGDNPVIIRVRERMRVEASFRLRIAGRVHATDEGAVEIDVEVSEARCGNGVVELGEACDDAESNGHGSWCDRSCLFRCGDDGCPLRVDPAAAKPGDGSSWDAPLKDLRQALQTSTGELWVRGGDFSKLPGGESVTLGGRLIVRGGFDGTERTPAERLPSAPRTRIPGVQMHGSPGAVIERVAIGTSPPSSGDQGVLGLDVADVDDLRLVDVEFRNARVELARARVRFENVDIQPPYDQPAHVRESNFAWVGGSLSSAKTYASLQIEGSRVLLQKLDVNGSVSLRGDVSEGVIVGCNFHGFMYGAGGAGNVLSLSQGIIADSTFWNGRGVGSAAIEGGKLFIWNSSFLGLEASSLRGGYPRAAAVAAEEVEIVASTFYENVCTSAPSPCNLDVHGVKRVTASLFVQEDRMRSIGQPASPASAYPVDLEEGLGGNCFTYARSAFTLEPSHRQPLLARSHPCPDAADASELEGARRRFMELVEPYRIPFFDADVGRYAAPDWWHRQTVRAGRCRDEGAPDPGAHHVVPCPR